MNLRNIMKLSAFIVLALTGCIAFDLLRKGDDPSKSLLLAIRQYRVLHGAYPLELSDLVNSGFITSIPTVSSSILVRRGDFEYFADQDLDFFLLSFLEKDIFGGLGPPKAREMTYISYKNSWEFGRSTSLDLSTPLGAAMDCAGRRFQEDGTATSLDLFVRKTVQYAKFSPVYSRTISKSYLTEALGLGEMTTVDGKDCLLYSSKDARRQVYYFVISRYGYISDDSGDRVSRILCRDATVSPPVLREIYHE